MVRTFDKTFDLSIILISWIKIKAYLSNDYFYTWRHKDTLNDLVHSYKGRVVSCLARYINAGHEERNEYQHHLSTAKCKYIFPCPEGLKLPVFCGGIAFPLRCQLTRFHYSTTKASPRRPLPRDRSRCGFNTMLTFSKRHFWIHFLQ